MGRRQSAFVRMGKIALKKTLLSTVFVAAMFTASIIACSVGRANPMSGPVRTETILSYLDTDAV